MREALGPEFGLLVEVHRRLAPMHAIRIGKRIAEFDVGWYEEPCLCDNIELVAEVRRALPGVPIVTGEAIYSKEAFAQALAARAADIINPDICNCGGISAMLDIAAMAQPHAVAVAPHNYNSTLVGLAATVQLAALIPNFWIAEFFVNLQSACDEVATRNLVVKDSFVELPTTPGHGVDLDVDKLRAHPYRDMGARGGHKGLRSYTEEFPRKNYVVGATRTGY
jgi:galactonate dehydratase